MNVRPLNEQEIFGFLALLGVLVTVARAFGELAVRLRQPQVLGELLAGVVLAPFALGRLIGPSGYHQVQLDAKLLEPVGWLGIIFLLALTGFETDVDVLRRQGRRAFSASTGGIIVPIIGGFTLGQLLPESLIGSGGSRFVFSLFLALAMSISAVSVIAKVLFDLGATKRTAAKIILAGGVFDETIGYILLAVVTGLAGRGSGGLHVGDVLRVIGLAAAFLAASVFFGRPVVEGIVRLVRDRMRINEPVLTVTIVLALGFAAITQALGLHVILGAFVFGLIAGQVSRIDADVVSKIRSITVGFLAPLFFVFAGMRVDLSQLTKPEVLLVAVAFVMTATIGKVAGCLAGGRLSGMPWSESLVVGIGMNVRGSMEVVVAVIGLNLGILSPTMFSVVVLLSVLTVLTTPTLLRLAFTRFPPGPEEQARIAKEEAAASAYTPGVRRVLVPILPSGTTEIGLEAARALTRSKSVAAEPLEIGVLHLGDPNDGVPERYAELRLNQEIADTPKILGEHINSRSATLPAIIQTAERGYQLVVLGTIPPERPAQLFGRLINDLIRDAPCDLFIVSSALGFEIENVRRIVVPINGKDSSRAGCDLALSLASGLNASVLAIHVMREVSRDIAEAVAQVDRLRYAAISVMRDMRERAAMLDVPFEDRIETSRTPANFILQELASPESDLCIMGVTDQSHRGTPFFGETPDVLLRHSPTPLGLLVVR